MFDVKTYDNHVEKETIRGLSLAQTVSLESLLIRHGISYDVVEVSQPTPRAADLRQHCGHHAKYLFRLGNGKLICGYCGTSH